MVQSVAALERQTSLANLPPAQVQVWTPGLAPARVQQHAHHSNCPDQVGSCSGWHMLGLNSFFLCSWRRLVVFSSSF